MMRRKMTRVRRMALASAMVAGSGLAVAGVASAANNPTTTTSSSSSTAPNPATLTHGPGETLLTGTALANATAAAEAAEPGATIIRVETDSGGATYEAHMTKADGSIVTVKMDATFKVTSIESGFGTGPSGSMSPPSGAAPDATPPTGAPATGTAPTGGTSSSTST